MNHKFPKPKKAVALVPLLLLLTIIVACGGAAATPAPTTAPPAADAAPAAAAGSTPTAAPQPASQMDIPAPIIEPEAQRGGILRTARPSDVRFLDAPSLMTPTPPYGLYIAVSSIMTGLNQQ